MQSKNYFHITLCIMFYLLHDVDTHPFLFLGMLVTTSFFLFFFFGRPLFRTYHSDSSCSTSICPLHPLSSLTPSICLILVFLIPDSSISNIPLSIYPLSLLCMCPNHLNLASITLSPSYSTCPVPLMMSLEISCSECCVCERKTE